MKKIISVFPLIIIIFFVLALSSCGDSEEINDFVPSEFTVGNLELQFTRLSSSKDLNIRCSQAPTVSSNQSWVTVTQPKLLGQSSTTYVTTITVSENEGYEDRTAQISVSCAGQTKTVSILQKAGEGLQLISFDPQDGEISAQGQQVSVTLEATSEYEITLEGAISRMEARSMEKHTEFFVITPNYSGVKRTMSVTFTLKADPGKTFSVSFSQGCAEGLSGLSAIEIAKNMTNGINIGNTLEATGGETSWGALLVNRDYVHGMRVAGFDAVRIPCCWNIYMDQDNIIDPQWLQRVYDVVGYCIDEGMYVVLNDHWDEGWLENDIPNGYNEQKAQRLWDMWVQISEKMANYDQHLLFAGLNEPNAETEAAANTLMRYEQVFVDAVRSTGGTNADRVLVVQAPNTSLELAEKYLTLPNDVVKDRIMIETHFYGPYQFTLMEEDANWGKTFWFWGKDNYKAGSDRNSTWGDELWIHDQCMLLYNKFTTKGIPTIMGEFGCMVRNNLKGDDYELHQKSRRDWSHCVVVESKKAGAVPFLWDTPGGLINRKDGSVTDPLMLEAICSGATQTNYPF